MYNKDSAIDLCFSSIETKPNQTRFYFKNGYGASVINHGYGSSNGLYELCLLKGDNVHYIDDSCYEDVIGYLTMNQILGHLHNISQLSEVKS